MKTLRILLPLVLTVLAGVWLGGCSTTYRTAGIACSLTDVKIGSDNTAVLQMHLRNENIVAVGVTTTEVQAHLNGVSYGRATGGKSFAMKECGEADYEVTLRLDGSGAAERLKAALAAGALDYRLECRFICDVGDERLILSTTANGRTLIR